jgi:hypothetical protein
MTSTTILSALVASLTLLASMGAQAQTIESVKAEPARAAVGQPVKLTTQFVVDKSINCKVRVHFGDGNTTDFMVNQTKDVPLVLEHSYTKAGKYTARVEGRGAARCMGDAINVDVEVQNKVAVAAASATPLVTNVACPAGWRLTKAGVNKKTGAFTCSAKAQTPVADPRITCPGDLTYFENVKKGQLGCRV